MDRVVCVYSRCYIYRQSTCEATHRGCDPSSDHHRNQEMGWESAKAIVLRITRPYALQMERDSRCTVGGVIARESGDIKISSSVQDICTRRIRAIDDHKTYCDIEGNIKCIQFIVTAIRSTFSPTRKIKTSIEIYKWNKNKIYIKSYYKDFQFFILLIFYKQFYNSYIFVRDFRKTPNRKLTQFTFVNIANYSSILPTNINFVILAKY